MARYLGPGQISGRIGNLVFKRGKNGETIVSEYNPRPKSAISANQRKTMTEFTAVAHAGKLFRDRLGPLYKDLADRDAATRLTKAFTSVIKLGEGERGKRTISLRENGWPMIGYNINERSKYNLNVLFQTNIELNKERSAATLKIPAFSPYNYIAPKGSNTHFRVVFGMMPFADWKWQEKKQKFEPEYPDLQDAISYTHSEYIPIQAANNPEMKLEIALVGNPIPKEVAVVMIMGMEYFQEVNGAYYPSISESSMAIQEIR